MSSLTYAQLRQLATNAGFGKNADIAAAIAMAESSGNPSAIGDVGLQTAKWGPSVGLWQIRSLKNPSAYTGADAMRDANKLKDPAYNASVAKAIFDQRASFGPWSTFDNGKGTFLKFLQSGGGSATSSTTSTATNAVYTGGGSVQTTGFLSDAKDGVTGLLSDAAGGAAGVVGDVAGSAVGLVLPDAVEVPLAKGLGLITSGAFWQRAGWFASGYVCVLAGLLIVLLSNKDVKGAAKGVGGTAFDAAIGLVPGGGTAKAVAGGATKATKAVAKGASGAARAAGSGAAEAAKTVGKAASSK